MVFFQVLGNFSHQAWLRIGAECREFSVISSTRNEEMLSGTGEMEAKLDAEAKLEASRIFAMQCENFARIAKISQP